MNSARIRRRLEAAVRQAAATATVDSANMRGMYEMALLVKLGFASRPEVREKFEKAWRDNPDTPHIPFRTELIDEELWRKLGRPKRKGWQEDEDQRPHSRYRFPWTQDVLIRRDTGNPPRDIRELRKYPDPNHWRIVKVEHTAAEEPKAEHFVNWVPYTKGDRDADIRKALDAYDGDAWLRAPDGQSPGGARGLKPEDAFVPFAKNDVDWPMYRAMGQTKLTVSPQHDSLFHALSGSSHDMKSVMRQLVATLKRMEEDGDPDAPWMIAYMAHKRLGRVARTARGRSGAAAGLGQAARRVMRAADAEDPPPEPNSPPALVSARYPVRRRGSTYYDIGHKVGAEVVLWAWLRGRVLTRTITNRRSKDTSRSNLEVIHEDMPWSMSDARAKGRIDPSAGIGSVIFETQSEALQLRIADALVDMFPEIRWSVFSEVPPVPLREFCEDRRASRVAAPARGATAGEPPAPESEIRAMLRAGLMAGATYRSVFRPAGSNQAVVEIMGRRFTIDDSGRLPLAGMRLVGGRGRSQLGPGKTQRDVNAFFGLYPRLGPEDFAPIRRSR